MDRKYFRDILRKYLKNRATPDEVSMIDAWYRKMENDAEGDTDAAADSALEDKYWASIQSHVKNDQVRRITIWKSIGVAASLLVVGLAAFFVIKSQRTAAKLAVEDTVASPAWQYVFNSGKDVQRITLSDGSTVALEPESRLRFPSAFDDEERHVFLEGEAFFDVARNEKSPFLVYTSQLTTKVLGTSFTVNAYAHDKCASVAVKTGTVAVTAKTEGKDHSSAMPEIILTPNQQVVFDTESKKLSRMIVEEPVPLLPADEVRKMRFEGAPVTEIFRAIENVYGVDLVFDYEKFSTCMLTSVISDGDLYNRLDIICKAIGATYSFKENQILIDGTGCDSQ